MERLPAFSSAVVHAAPFADFSNANFAFAFRKDCSNLPNSRRSLGISLLSNFYFA